MWKPTTRPQRTSAHTPSCPKAYSCALHLHGRTSLPNCFGRWFGCCSTASRHVRSIRGGLCCCAALARPGTKLPLLSSVASLVPWNLRCEDRGNGGRWCGDLQPAAMHFGSHAIMSREATHNYNAEASPPRIRVALWSVLLDLGTGNGRSLRKCRGGYRDGNSSETTRSLDAWGVYAGAPVAEVKERTHIRTTT